MAQQVWIRLLLGPRAPDSQASDLAPRKCWPPGWLPTPTTPSLAPSAFGKGCLRYLMLFILVWWISAILPFLARHNGMILDLCLKTTFKLWKKGKLLPGFLGLVRTKSALQALGSDLWSHHVPVLESAQGPLLRGLGPPKALWEGHLVIGQHLAQREKTSMGDIRMTS